MVLFSRKKGIYLLSALICCMASQPLAASAALYKSDDAVWLRSSQSTGQADNKICVIPKGATISVSKEEFGWGYATYTASDGTVYQGWTAMYLYSPEDTKPVANGESTTVSGSRSYIYQYLVNTLNFAPENAQAVFDRMDAVLDNADATETDAPSGIASSDTKKKVYTYLTETLGLNRASACAVMVNIQEESGFDPTELLIIR